MRCQEPPSEEIWPALVAAAEAFEDWERLLTEALTAHGADPDRAPGLAAVVVAAVERAIAPCRAKHSMRPLDRVAEELETLLTDALARPARRLGAARGCAVPSQGRGGGGPPARRGPPPRPCRPARRPAGRRAGAETPPPGGPAPPPPP
ncbi:LmrA/YxaF family transcription factor, partial [Streptomyces sp. NPDC054783]